MSRDPYEPTFFDDVAEFHEKFGLEVPEFGLARVIENDALRELREKRVFEEIEEYLTAQQKALWAETNGDLEKALEDQLDALVDAVYIILGTAYLQGFRFNEAWKRVHEANMKKLRAERPEQSKHGSTYDIIKPEGWEPPSHKDLVSPNFHRR